MMIVMTIMVVVVVVAMKMMLTLSVSRDPSLPRSQAGGIEVGDTLQKLDGVTLGSYKEGMEMFKKQSGSVVITVLRQDEITI